MTTVAEERPGVFCDDDKSMVVWNSAGRAVGIAAASVRGEAGRVYRVRSADDAARLFGSPGEGSILSALCALALKNGAAEVAAVPAGQGESLDYTTALGALEAEEAVFAVTCDSEDPAVHALLSQSVQAASAAGRERIGCASRARGDELQSWATSFQNERLLLVCQEGLDEAGKPLPGCYLAAALLARTAAGADPAEAVNGAVINGVPRLAGALTEPELDALVRLGVTPFEEVAGRVEIVRAVTSRTQTEGEEDTSFRDLSTILLADDVLVSVRKAQRRLPGAQNSARTRRSIASQAALVLEEKKRRGRISSYRAPDVRADGSDPSLCVVTLDFTVESGFHQIVLSVKLESA